MTLIQEIRCLGKLEKDILKNGKIRQESSESPFPLKEDEERLIKCKFYELQDKYSYGWYIAEETFEQQLISISEFKIYILKNFKDK